ncbi:hypothetical protein AKO1_010433, partial [Acrasis kona]
MERSPMKQTVNVDSFLRATKVKRAPKVQYDHEQIKDVLLRLRKFIGTRRVILKPRFQDFDVYNRGKVSRSQFSQCLDKIFDFTESELNMLVSNYYEEHSGLCNYLKFIEDVDNDELNTQGNRSVHAEFEFTRSKAMSTPEEEFQKLDPDLQSLIFEIRSQVSQHRIRLRQFFTDHDKLRHGEITPNKFKAGLDMANIHLTKTQLKLLEDNLMVKKSDGLELVRYVDFCDYVDLVFTEPKLEKQPTKQLFPFLSRPRFTLKYHKVELPEDKAEQLERIYKDLAETVNARHVLLKPYFQDYDPLRKERVTQTQFASVLDMLHLNLNQQSVKLLADRYMDERRDVDYVSLCKDL